MTTKTLLDGVAIRALTHRDIDAGLRLCRIAGWNQRQADWAMFLRLRPQGCFAAVCMGYVVGTVVTLDYASRAGWVGMVLVDPAHRRRGIGTRLLQAALDSLGACACVKLDATPEGSKVYAPLGFAASITLDRLVRPARPTATHPNAAVRQMTEADMGAVAALDATAFGVERRNVMAALYAVAPRYAWVISVGGGRVAGFAMGRPGEGFEHIGPIVAADAEQAAALAGAALGAVGDRPAGIDALAHAGWSGWLDAAGFVRQRSFLRMVHGADAARERTNLLFAVSGPEMG